LPPRAQRAILAGVITYRQEFSVRFSSLAHAGPISWYTDMSRPPLSR